MAFLLLAACQAAPAGEQVQSFTLPDTEGKQHTLYEHSTAKTVVLIFLGTECPLANRYLPRLNDLRQAYGPRGVVFMGVNSNALETVEAIAKHATENRLTFPMLLDREHRVADALQVRLTPTAIVIDSSRRLRYRGRIDDHKSEDLVKTRHLRDALDAVLAGKDVAIAETDPEG